MKIQANAIGLGGYILWDIHGISMGKHLKKKTDGKIGKITMFHGKTHYKWGKSPCLMGKLTINDHFNSKLLVYQWISSGYPVDIPGFGMFLNMFDYPISSHRQGNQADSRQMCSWGRFPTPMAARCDDSSGVSAVFP